MTIDVLATLTADELNEFRRLEGMHHGIQSQCEAGARTPAEIQRFYIRYWQYVGALLNKYDIQMDEREECRISPYTGQIYLGGE